MAAAADMTAMMMSIALTGGSPGSSPKRKTRMSVPTPPHRPSPMPPDRTPSAMKPTTISPSIAITGQSVLLGWGEARLGPAVGVRSQSVLLVSVEAVSGAGVLVGVAAGVVDVVEVVVAAGAAADPCGPEADEATNPARPSSTHAVAIVR